MRCLSCHHPIRPGLEAEKRFEYRKQPDGTVKVFGPQAPDGKLSEATGTLVAAQHQKHYWVARKRVARGGDAVAGTHPELMERYGE